MIIEKLNLLWLVELLSSALSATLDSFKHPRPVTVTLFIFLKIHFTF